MITFSGIVYWSEQVEQILWEGSAGHQADTSLPHSPAYYYMVC